MVKRLIMIAVLLVPVSAQERLDPKIVDKIRQEEAQHSQIMRTLHFLADVHGPRLTGPPLPQYFGPTEEQLAAYLNTVKDQVRGRIVLVGKAAFVPVNLAAPPGRLTDEEVRRRYDPDAPDAGRGGRGNFQQPTPPPGTL